MNEIFSEFFSSLQFDGEQIVVLRNERNENFPLAISAEIGNRRVNLREI